MIIKMNIVNIIQYVKVTNKDLNYKKIKPYKDKGLLSISILALLFNIYNLSNS